MAYVDKKRTARDLVHRKNRTPEKKATRNEPTDPLGNIVEDLAAALILPGTTSAPTEPAVVVPEVENEEQLRLRQIEQQRYEEELRLVELQKRNAEKNAEHVRQVGEAEQRVREAASDVSKIQQELQTATLQAEQEKHNFQRVLTELQNRRVELDERLQSLHEHQASRLREHAELVDSFEQQIESERASLTSLEAELEDAKTGVVSEQELTEQHAGAITQLHQQKEALAQHIQQARHRVVAAQEERQTLIAEIADLKDSIDTDRQTLQSIDTSIDTSAAEQLTTEVSQLRTDAAQLAAEVDEKQKAVATRRQAEQERNTELQKSRDDELGRVTKLRDKLKVLLEPAEAIDRESEVAAEIQTMRSDLHRLKLEVAAARSRQAEFQQVRQQLEQHLIVKAELEGQLSSHQQELAKLTADTAGGDKTDELEQLKSHVTSLRDEFKLSAEQVEQRRLATEQQHEQLDRELALARQTLGELQSQARQSQAEYDAASESLRRDVQTRQQTIDDLHAGIRTAREELESFRLPDAGVTAALDADITELNRHLEETREATETRRQQLQQAEVDLREAQSQRDQLVEVVTSARGQLSELQDVPLPVVDESLTAELENLTTQKTQLLEAVRTTRERIESRTQLKQQEEAEHTAEVQSLRTEIDELQSQLSQVRSQSEATLNGLSTKIRDLSAQKVSLSDSLADAQRELQASRSDVEDRSTQLRLERSELEATIDAGERRLNELRIQIRETQPDTSAADISQLKSRKEKLEAEIEATSHELQETRQAVTDAHSQSEATLAELKTTIDSLATRKSSVSSLLTQTRHELETSRSTIRSQVEQQEENRSRLEAAIAADEQELQQLRTQVLATRSEEVQLPDNSGLERRRDELALEIRTASHELHQFETAQPAREDVPHDVQELAEAFEQESLEVDIVNQTIDTLSLSSFSEEIGEQLVIPDAEPAFAPVELDSPGASLADFVNETAIDDLIGIETDDDMDAPDAEARAIMDSVGQEGEEFFDRPAISPAATSRLKPTGEPKLAKAAPVSKTSGRKPSRGFVGRESNGQLAAMSFGLWLFAIATATVGCGCGIYLASGSSEATAGAWASFLSIGRWVAPLASLAGAVLLAATPRRSEGRREWLAVLVSVAALIAAWWFVPTGTIPGWLLLVTFAASVGLAVALSSLMISLTEYFDLPRLEKSCDKLLAGSMVIGLCLAVTLLSRLVELPVVARTWMHYIEVGLLGLMALWLAICSVRLGGRINHLRSFRVS